MPVDSLINMPGRIFAQAGQEFLESEAHKFAFSGADIHAYIGNRKVGTLVSLTVSVTREVMPLYTFGNPSPRTFVKGKRGIAGSMTFTQFDKHALIGTLIEQPNIQYLWDWIKSQSDLSLSNSQREIKDALTRTDSQLAGASSFVADRVRWARMIVGSRPLRYVDQIPPFDMTLAFVNESGAFAYLELYGIQFVNEGFGYTLDDLASEIAVTFVCTGIKPLSNTLTR